MREFKELKLKGKFRSYQQKILDNSDRYISDGKIHIVAAPGSGKTVLGLELMIRIGAPALVLSPTLVISRQWGERFSEMYLPDSDTEDEYVSYTMKDPRVITSVTYQMLHFAVKKQWEKEEDVDFRKFDLMEFIKTHNIGTICLDEAHHLRRAWERSLEGFLDMLPRDVKVIALTATPPYDSVPVEWNRYLNINGQIDDEIFVPELVAQGTLCPHQDYIYFNAPTGDEYARIEEYYLRADNCVRELLASNYLTDAISVVYSSLEKNKALFFRYGRENTALAVIATHNGQGLQQNILKMISYNMALPEYSVQLLEKAINHVLSHPEIFPEQICDGIREICSRHRVMSHGKAILASNDKINKIHISSLGKLESISKIADAEHRNLGPALRMCVLTDYIRKEYLKFIGSSERIASMGVVPIFESLRRALPKDAKIGVLTGSLIIWPTSGLDELSEISLGYDMNMSATQIGITDYSEVVFNGGNNSKVAVITEAFRRGGAQIVVGTAALLGEGWNSPCVNSMILASFVSSYVLSNQMRGRAIRTFSEDPDKTANIWHLVTVETGAGDIRLTGVTEQYLLDQPQNVSQQENSEFIGPEGVDFETLKRRFLCFFGPDYDGKEIRSGIERINIIKGPYNRTRLASINNQMIERATNRKLMADTWNNCIESDLSLEIADVNSIPKIAQTSRSAKFTNALYTAISSTFTGLSIWFFIMATMFSSLWGGAGIILGGVSAGVLVLITGKIVNNFLRVLSPVRTIRGLAESLLASMKQLSLIRTDNVSVEVTTERNSGIVRCSLNGGSVREKGLFANAINDMLSPIDNPKYIAVRRSKTPGGYNFFQSYSCPSFVSNAKAANILKNQLKKHLGNFSLEYTKNEKGYWLLTICQNSSVMNILSKKGGIRRFHSAGRSGK